MPYRVAVTDYNFGDLELERAILEPLGIECVAAQCKMPSEIAELCESADAVITQFAPVNAEAIARMKQARAIVRYGIGFDNVDIEAAKARNIPVCNIPDYCIDEVADHTLGFVLALTRQVVTNHNHVASGHWGLATPLTQMRTLRDLTVGCVGFGRIGREVVKRLAAFKCKILVFDPFIDPSVVEKLGASLSSLDHLLQQSDIVTLHCPSSQQTRGLLNRDSLAMVKKGAAIINLARGDLIVTQALIHALESGHLSGAALDVFSPEPLPLDSPLRRMSNVILASHIASASPKAVQTLRQTAARIAAAAIQNQPLNSIVNGVVPRSH